MQGLAIGLVLAALGVCMFLLSLPRQGQVVGFLRGRDTGQALYMMTVVLLFALGLIVTLSNLGELGVGK
jgi:hypothetical protein